jgi:hypothetical protein
LSNRRLHKPILRAATTETVRRITAIEASPNSELSNELLDCIVVDLLVDVNQPVTADVWENVVVRLELPTQELVLQEIDPSIEV